MYVVTKSTYFSKILNEIRTSFLYDENLMENFAIVVLLSGRSKGGGADVRPAFHPLSPNAYVNTLYALPNC